MKTCTIKSVFEAIIRLRGWDPVNATIDAGEMAFIADLINERMSIYEDAFWPEIMMVEQRQYRGTFSLSLNYATGDEVYYKTAAGEEKYYVSLSNANVGKNPETEVEFWEAVSDDFLRTIDYQQEGEAEIGAADLEDCIFENDPRIYPRKAALSDISFYGAAILVGTETAPTRPWVKFRPPKPVFSLTEWASGTDYAIGDTCYLASTGESYKALLANTGKTPDQETTYWTPVGFPLIFKTYIKYAVHADWLTDWESKARIKALADEELERLEDTLIDQQGVGRKVRFG